MELFKKYADMVLLAHFLKNPPSRFHVKGLAKELGLSPSSVSLASRRFELDGILRSEREGSKKLYTLNNDSPLVKAFKVVYTLARIHETKLVERFLKADGSTISIALYGDFASGTYGERSPLNLLALSQKGARVFEKALEELEGQLGLKIGLEAIKIGKWNELVKARDPFCVKVLSNHVLLFGPSLA